MKIINICALSLACLFLTTLSHAQGTPACNSPFIVMDGIGEIESIPDIAEISLNIKSSSKTESEALEGLAKNMQRVIDVLKKLKIKDEDIRKDSVNIYPEYDDRNNREIIAYNGTSGIHFKTRDLKNITELLSNVMKGSANMFSNINYSSSKEDDLNDEARKAAFKKAYDKAKLYAELSGNKLGQICTISEGSIHAYIPSFRNNMNEDSMMMAGSAPKANYSIPIKPGMIKTTANVTLTYGLE